MDTQTFLNDLKRYAERSTESPQNSNEFFSNLEKYYYIYVSATPEEREKIRGFVNSPPLEDVKPRSFFGKLFQSKQSTSQIAHLLLIFVKERALPQLKSTKDPAWLYRGLVAISMDDFTGTFNDQTYTGYPMAGDATFLLADLYVTAEENGINPEPIFKEISEISNPRPTKYLPMKDFISNVTNGKLAYERRQNGKFVGMF